VTLERARQLRAILTQNIDRLHQKACSAPDLVLKLHGSTFESVCLSCDDRRDMREALARVRGGETDPPCDRCGSILKSEPPSWCATDPGHRTTASPLRRYAARRAEYRPRSCLDRPNGGTF
jgi:hypothetical protein